MQTCVPCSSFTITYEKDSGGQTTCTSLLNEQCFAGECVANFWMYTEGHIRLHAGRCAVAPVACWTSRNSQQQWLCHLSSTNVFGSSCRIAWWILMKVWTVTAVTLEAGSAGWQSDIWRQVLLGDRQDDVCHVTQQYLPPDVTAVILSPSCLHTGWRVTSTSRTCLQTSHAQHYKLVKWCMSIIRPPPKVRF